LCALECDEKMFQWNELAYSFLGSEADKVGGVADRRQAEAAAEAERTGTHLKHDGNFLDNFR
jgi:hypothetical protein